MEEEQINDNELLIIDKKYRYLIFFLDLFLFIPMFKLLFDIFKDEFISNKLTFVKGFLLILPLFILVYLCFRYTIIYLQSIRITKDKCIFRFLLIKNEFLLKNMRIYILNNHHCINTNGKIYLMKSKSKCLLICGKEIKVKVNKYDFNTISYKPFTFSYINFINEDDSIPNLPTISNIYNEFDIISKLNNNDIKFSIIDDPLIINDKYNTVR